MSFLHLPGAYEIIPLAISAALMRLDSEDDKQFMATLYMTHRKQLFSYALRLSNRREDAEDAVQEAFLSLIPKVAMLRKLEEQRLMGYVFMTVKHAVYFLKRKEHRCGQPETEELSEASDQPEAELLFQSSVEELEAACRQLSDRDQTLLRMKYYMNQSDSEIAAMFKVKESSVRVMIHRARERLSKILKEGSVSDE